MLFQLAFDIKNYKTDHISCFGFFLKRIPNCLLGWEYGQTHLGVLVLERIY